jgi:hypothetical protein
VEKYIEKNGLYLRKKWELASSMGRVEPEDC